MSKINDFFKLDFNGGLFIIDKEYHSELLEFLRDRQTALPYLAKRYSIQDISDFLREPNQITKLTDSEGKK